MLSVRLALGLTYSLIVPPWEAYDEDGHFAYARYLAVHRALLQPGDPEAEQIWERFQPPLYYALIAPAISWLDLGERFQSPVRNPYFVNGNAGVNYALHPDLQTRTDQQTALAVLVARAGGVVISTLSVFFVHQAAGLVWPREPSTRWTATCLYAFWPLFLFTGSMVTNDVLVTGLSAVFFYLALLIVLNGLGFRRGLLLGVVLAGALLTKLNAVALIPVGAAALLIGAGQSKPGRNSLSRYDLLCRWSSLRLWATLVGITVLAAASLWFLSAQEFVTAQIFQARTVIDFLRFAPDSALSGGRQGLGLIPAAIRYGFKTFLASFGWGNLEAYPWLYWLWAIGAALAAGGLAMASYRGAGQRQVKSASGLRRECVPMSAEVGTHSRRTPGFIALLGLQIISLVGLALALAISQRSMFLLPGRYLLPALPAASFLLVSGWRELLPRNWRIQGWKAVSLGVVLVGWSIPFKILAPAYARPQPLARDARAGVDIPLAVDFGNAIELMGYARPGTAIPGKELQISLCWRAIAPVPENHAVFLEIVGPDGQGYGRLKTYPGRGNYATSLWEVNVPFCDEYTVAVGKELPAPAAASLRVSMLRVPGDEPLPVQSASGEPAGDSVEIPIKVPPPMAEPSLNVQPVEYHFGGGIVLRGYEIRELLEGKRGVEVELVWEALKNIQEDYVVFVHLRDTPESAYAQDDRPPRQGWYPTSLWEKGEVVVDTHTLRFPDRRPAGPLALYVGLYERDTAVRPPVFDAQGNPVANDEVILEEYPEFPQGLD